jgi:hypothetical protein
MIYHFLFIVNEIILGIVVIHLTVQLMTFIAGEKGILRYGRVRQHILKKDMVCTYLRPQELEGDLAEAGFAEFNPQVFGSGIFFIARKRA